MDRRVMTWTAAATAVLTLLTFAVSATTLPLSGPFCSEGCFSYPYLDTASRWPRDYYWMVLASLLAVLVVVLMGAVHETAASTRRVWSRMAVTFGAMGATVLLVSYAVQLSVIQPSLLAGETDGIALISQFNPHGILIALEELGYTLLAVAFGFAAPVPQGRRAASRAVRWSLGLALPLTLAAFIGISMTYGLAREYLFEVAVITIVWFCLFAGSAGLAFWFRDVEPARE